MRCNTWYDGAPYSGAPKTGGGESRKEKSVMSENNIVVAVYAAHADAEQGVKALQKSGFDMKKLSMEREPVYAVAER